MIFVFKDNSKNGGIYRIQNLINNCYYIGSTKKFKDRFSQHICSLMRNKHHNIFLQRDYNKCFQKLGHNDFLIFEVIEIIDDKDLRIKCEQQYLDEYFGNELCYNLGRKASPTIEGIKQQKEEIKRRKSEILKERWATNSQFRNRMSGKNSPSYGKKCSEETKRKIAEANKGNTHTLHHHHTKETREKISKAHKGKIISEEQRKAHSAKMKGRKLTEEHKRKISLSEKGRKQSAKWHEAIKVANSKWWNVLLIDPEGNIFGPIFNLNEFCKEHNLKQPHLRSVIIGKRKSHYGWKLLKVLS